MLDISYTMTSIDDVVGLIARSKKIVFICGAGISVSCGIFSVRDIINLLILTNTHYFTLNDRSKGIGIYNQLNCDAIGIPSPELLFDSDFFDIDPAPFYKFAKALLPNDLITPSITHKFLAAVETHKKLHRVYTQNIDGLERIAGVKKVFECHGSFSSFRCTKCHKKELLNDVITTSISNGDIALCKICDHVLKPSITFFGDKVSSGFDRCLAKDLVAGCDLVIAVGTSLEVKGSIYQLLIGLDQDISRVLVNLVDFTQTRKLPFAFDHVLVGQCDDIFSTINDKLQWPALTSAPSSPTSNIAYQNTVETKVESVTASSPRTTRRPSKGVRRVVASLLSEEPGTVKDESPLYHTLPIDASLPPRETIPISCAGPMLKGTRGSKRRLLCTVLS